MRWEVRKSAQEVCGVVTEGLSGKKGSRVLVTNTCSCLRTFGRDWKNYEYQNCGYSFAWSMSYFGGILANILLQFSLTVIFRAKFYDMTWDSQKQDKSSGQHFVTR